jgi:hypothetical protein
MTPSPFEYLAVFTLLFLTGALCAMLLSKRHHPARKGGIADVV